MASDRDRPRNLGVHGPERDRIIDEAAAQRNDRSTQASHQPGAHDSTIGDRDATRNAARATEANDEDDQPSHLGEAEDAFERSRGDRAGRGEPEGNR